MGNRKKWPVLVLAASIFVTVASTPAGAVGTGTMQVNMETDKTSISVNGESKTWEAAPVLINNQVYVPLKLFGDVLGVKVEWNAKTKMVEMTVPKVKVMFDIDHNEAYFNKVKSPLDSVGAMVDGRLMVRLNWFTDMVGGKSSYDAATKKIDFLYTKLPDELIADDNENSRPVAKFTFGKETYRVGEPVKYYDLSYDPDAEGIAKYEWTGKEPVFHTPGKYPITLKVTDGNGHVSKEYTRTLIVTDSIYATPLEYKLYFTEVGTAFKTDWSEIWSNFNDLPALKRETVEDRSRKLILSDSPETITEKGILYQDKVNGKARLYADHVNGSESKVQFVIMARNTSTTQPVTITTTNKGEVYPSIYANLIGHEASVDFMLRNPVTEKPLTLAPGQGLAYVRMPDFYPGQGVNLFYDVETSGEVEFTFMALDSSISTPTGSLIPYMQVLKFNGNVRGTFPVSDLTWKADMKDVTKPVRITIGDGKEDPFIKGYDTERKAEVLNEGNYGMIYNLQIANPPKMAVLLMGRGGPFKGPFKVNGEFNMVPYSGVLEAFTSIHVLARTTGEEESLNLEFTPPAGSAFPVDLIFYPLKDLK